MGMIENRCPACHAVMETGAEVCPVCKMKKINVLGEDAEALKILEQYGKLYADNILQNIEIGVLAHKYREDGDHYTEDSRQYVKLFEISEMIYDQIVWSDYKFGQGSHEKDIVIDVVVKNGKKESRTAVTAKALALKDFWCVGATLKDGFTVTLTIGNRQENTTTGPVSLILE